MVTTPAKAAREAADLTPAAAAKKLRVSPEYLLQCERRQEFSWALARRAAMLYRCDVKRFLPQPMAGAYGQRPEGGARGGGGRRISHPQREQIPESSGDALVNP